MSDGWNYDLSQAISGRDYIVSYQSMSGPQVAVAFRIGSNAWGNNDESFNGVYAFRDLPEPAPLPQEAK